MTWLTAVTAIGALAAMTPIGASIREVTGMGLVGVMTMMIGNHMRVGSRLSVMTALRAPVGLMAGVGVVGVMTMMISARVTVAARLSVMTALRAPVGLMAGVGVVGVMTMMIGARVTVAPLLAAIGAAIGMVAGVGVGMMAGARTIRSMSYTCLWMRQWRRCEPGTSSRTSSTTHCARLSHAASGERCRQNRQWLWTSRRD